MKIQLAEVIKRRSDNTVQGARFIINHQANGNTYQATFELAAADIPDASDLTAIKAKLKAKALAWKTEIESRSSTLPTKQRMSSLEGQDL